MNPNIYVPRSVEIARELAIEEVHDCLAGEIVKAVDVLPKDDEFCHHSITSARLLDASGITLSGSWPWTPPSISKRNRAASSPRVVSSLAESSNS